MPAYYAILTTLGLNRLADAIEDNIPLVFTHLAVGDGGGFEITPDADMTELVNEVARVLVNNVEISPDAPSTLRVEGLILSGTGGFTIREAGLFNGDNELLAVASYPPIYKPEPADGVIVDEYIRILIEYATVEAVALTVDPDVIMATRLYVDEEIDRVLQGSIFMYHDEFTEAALDATIWNTAAVPVADNAAGGLGAIRINTSNDLIQRKTSVMPFPPGTRDFAFSCRARFAAFTGDMLFGMYSATSAKRFYFRQASGTANWAIHHNSGAAATAITVIAGYQHLVIERVNGTISFYVDGDLAYSDDDTIDYSDGYILLQGDGTAVGDTDCYTDFVRLWIYR